ncbi:MAG: carboxypeptidase-like regulatory domain-containing protein [Bacteroidia bacterium]
MRKFVKTLFLLCAVVAISTFTGCQKEQIGTSITPATITMVKASVIGQVLDDTGNPIKDASVQLTDGTTVQTDLNGNFTFTNQKLGSPYAYVKVSKQGYFHASRTFSCRDGKVHYVSIQMLPKTTRGTFNAASGGTVSFEGVEISLPANGVMYQNGGAYNGQVTVVAQYLNPQADNLIDIMPGDLLGYDNSGEMQSMKTFGMVAVELVGQNGEMLQIAQGAEATLSMPQVAGMTHEGDMPLWYFDETQGFWKQEGVAKLENGKWLGKVKHFSFWNCDIVTDPIRIHFTLKDENGKAIPDMEFLVHSPSLGTGHGRTDNEGYVTSMAPRNEVFTITILDHCDIAVIEKEIGPFVVETNLGTIALPSGKEVTYKGRVINCLSLPVTNGAVRATIGTGIGSRNYMAVVNADGTFSLSVPYCQNGLSATLYAVDFDNPAVPQAISATVSNGTQDVGTLIACGTSPLVGYVQITIDGVPTLISSNLLCSISPYQGNPADDDAFVNASDNLNSAIFNVISTPPDPSTGIINNLVINLNNTALPILNGITTNITSYPVNVGDYLDGNFTTTYTDGTGTHNLSCIYHLQKD